MTITPESNCLLVCTLKRGVFGLNYLHSEEDFYTHYYNHLQHQSSPKHHADKIYVTMQGDEFWDEIHNGSNWIGSNGDLGYPDHSTALYGDTGSRMQAKAKQIRVPSNWQEELHKIQVQRHEKKLGKRSESWMQEIVMAPHLARLVQAPPQPTITSYSKESFID